MTLKLPATSIKFLYPVEQKKKALERLPDAQWLLSNTCYFKGIVTIVSLLKFKIMEQQIIVGKRASSNFFRKMGTLIDLEKGLYKTYESVFGMTSGSWKKNAKV